MSTQPADLQSEDAAIPGPSLAPPSLLARYLRWLVLPLLLLYILPLVLIRIPGFEQWGGSTFGPALNFGFQSAGENADVVIFGDSSATVAIDARRLSSQLGLKVINLPNTGASLPVTGDLALRQYLAKNKPPRLIVFYFTAWDMDFEHPSGKLLGTYEGEEMLIAHGSLAQIFTFTVRHPSESLLFPIRFYSTNPQAIAIAALRHQHRAQMVAETLGQFDPMPNRPALPPSCTFGKEYLHPSRFETSRRLVDAYSSPSTQVLFYIAPIPACSNAGYYSGRSYDPISAAAPAELPPTAFKADGSYAHVVPAAVPRATELLDLAIRRALKLDPTGAEAQSR